MTQYDRLQQAFMDAYLTATLPLLIPNQEQAEQMGDDAFFDAVLPVFSPHCNPGPLERILDTIAKQVTIGKQVDLAEDPAERIKAYVGAVGQTARELLAADPSFDFHGENTASVKEQIAENIAAFCRYNGTMQSVKDFAERTKDQVAALAYAARVSQGVFGDDWFMQYALKGVASDSSVSQ